MKPKTSRKRLDLLLVERGCADSPQKAMAMILAGEVQVDGQRVEKAGMPVAQSARIEIMSRLQKFVSRGGTKLEGALEDFAVEPAGCLCLDIGSSNGGFTDFLLHTRARRRYALCVNIQQTDWKEPPHGCRRQSGVFSPRTQKDPGVESLTHMPPGQSFQTIGIISRPRRSNLVVVVPPLLKWLDARGIQALMDEETANCLPDGSKGQTRQVVPEPSQLLLVFGVHVPLLAPPPLPTPPRTPRPPYN